MTLGFTMDINRSLLSKVMFLFDLTVHTILLPVSLFILLHVNSSSAAVIITMANRGRCRTKKCNMGHNTLLSQSTSFFW